MGNNLIITDHAINRFIERSGVEADDPKDRIRQLFARSFEAAIDPVFKVRAIINNRFQEAKYRYSSGWVFVVIDNTITTVFKGEFKKGRIIPFVHNIK